MAAIHPREVEMTTCKPVNCVWELTLACDLRCGHCGSGAGEVRPHELTTDECLGVVDSLARLGGRLVTLSGGEPTLRPDWDVVARAIRDRGMIPNMVTNGNSVTPALAARMRDAGLANVAVSIDGPPEIHDRIRGAGMHARAARALATLAGAGVPTAVMTTANTLNLPHLEETCEAAERLGALSWRVQLGKPMGNLKTHDDWVLDPEDLLDLLPRLYRLEGRGGIRVHIGDSIGFHGPYDMRLRSMTWDGRPQRWGGCQAGLQGIGIQSDGGVKGCLSMQAFSDREVDPFVEGNVRERTLEDIWNDPASFAYNRLFKVADLTGFCRTCRYAAQCRGGARCVASASSGAIGEDAYCWHRVSELAKSRPLRRVARGVAAAASAFTIVLGGCCCSTPEYGIQTPDAGVPDAGASDAGVSDAGASDAGIDCTNVCCECDYGVLPAEVAAACCAAPEYGVEPPDCSAVDPASLDACCPKEPVDCSVASQCCATLDYGVNPPDCSSVTPAQNAACCVDCADICCECDYGILPPEVSAKCCTPAPDCSTVDQATLDGCCKK